jgi:flagellar hook protein FlgE
MSFQQGLSGLNATAKNLEVIGNNVANSNTFGAKASRAEFSDLYATALSGSGANNTGIGVMLGAVSQQFSQGNTVTTDNPMDLALNGGGFFQVSNGAGPTSYTRNGQFKVDRDGFIVNNNKEKLMGYLADGTGTIQPGQAVPLQVPTVGITPSATNRIKLDVNMDARAKVTAPDPSAVPQIDLLDASTYNNATSVSVYDVKGQDVSMVYFFQKAATDQWNVYITANGTPVTDDGSGNPLPTTTITFPTDGSAPTLPIDGLTTIDIPSTTNSVGAVTEPIMGVTLNFGGATQYGANFAVTDLSQNGYAPGQLTGIQFESNGIITARYSNGQFKSAGQVEIATFRNPQGLQAQGGNTWGRSYTSGDPIVGTPGDGNLGSLLSGALEASNVDLTAELVNMITAQRTYQANAQTIKTQDQVLQTLVNLR